MATTAELAKQGLLEKLDPVLDAHVQEERLIYALPTIVTWLTDTLPRMDSVLGTEDTPLEQVDAQFANFAEGNVMQAGQEFRCLKPHTKGVWEMRTPDIRIFGWFPEQDVFIAARANDASHIKDHGLYAGYIGEVERERDGLELNAPKFLTGGNIEDVLSD